MSASDPRQIVGAAQQLREATARVAEEKLEQLTLELSHEIDRIMSEKGITSVDLAIYGPSENTINRVRRGTNDSTLSTIVLILAALGHEVRCEIVPIGQSLPRDWKP